MLYGAGISGNAFPESRFRRDLARRAEQGHSPFIARLITEVDATEDIVRNRWAELDEPTKMTFRAMVIGAPMPKFDLSMRLRAIWDSLQMGWAIVWFRNDAYRYFARIYALIELIQERVGEEMWAETMASEDDVAAIERGRADAIAHRTIELVEK